MTEKGAEARERMIDRLNRFEAELQSGISRDELNQLTRTIRKLEENIK